MFETMDINQLQEQYMDLTGTERIACMRELARRFRDGIGIDVDLEEAEAWEKEADEAEQALRGPKQEQTKKASARIIQPAPDMSNWDNNRIYQAYMAGDLYAAAQFAVRLSKAGEIENAQEVCQKLIGKLEEDFSVEPTGQLLAQAKVLSGKLYERSKQPDKARVCYEEAVCELNYRPAVLPLANYYLAFGAKRFEKELKPLLAQLSTGSVEEKLIASDGYHKLGSSFEAAIHLENVLSDPQATSAQRHKAMRMLRTIGQLKQSDLAKKMESGDPTAYLVYAQELADQGKLEEAEAALSRLSDAGIRLDQHQSQIRDNITNQAARERERILLLQQEEERRKETIRRNKQAEELRRLQAERARKDREETLRQQKLQEEQERQRREEEKRLQAEKEKQARIRKLMRIPLAYVALILVIVAVFLVSSVVDLITLKKIDVFEDIEVVVSGAAPHATVEVYSNSSNPFVQSIHFYATPDNGLSNGDTITITADVAKSYAKQNGYRLADDTMKYKLKDVPSYITDTSDLKARDVEALFEKVKEAITGEEFQFKDLILDSGDAVAISRHLKNNVDNIELLNVGYTSMDTYWGVNSYTILTMKADLLDCEFDWYLNEYYEDGLVKDFKDVYFYVVFGGLKLDSDGKLIQNGEFSIDQSHVFMSKSAMELDMRDRYDDLVKGKVKN